jgi:hypothetical protein
MKLVKIAAEALFIAIAILVTAVGIVSYMNDDTASRPYMDDKEFVTKAMDITGAKLSPARKTVLIDTIVRVTDRVFQNDDQAKRQFIVIMAIESGLNPDISKSKVGAVGIAQIMPKYAQNFADLCELGQLSLPQDLENTEINMMLGACLFKSLINKFQNTSLAVIAYNSGQHSDAVSQLQKLTATKNTETAWYLAKFSYIAHLLGV